MADRLGLAGAHRLGPCRPPDPKPHRHLGHHPDFGHHPHSHSHRHHRGCHPLRLRFWPRVLLAFAVALLMGCTREATVLIVLVDTDLAVPRELDAVKATVESEPGRPLAHCEFLLTDSSTVSAPAEEHSSLRTITEIPFSFGVRPIDADPSRAVRVELTASIRLDGGPSMVRRSASTAFGDRQTLALPLWLERACAGVTCADEDTCIAGTCTPDRIDAAALLEITPGKEFDGLNGP